MRRRGSNEDMGFDQEESVYQQDRRDEVTVIGPGARLEGNLVSAGSLRIEGRVKGQITAEGDVIVAPEAEVNSDIRATNVTVAGNYKGNITASGTLELSSTAHVEGDLSCNSLIVNAGARFTGQANMDEPEASGAEEEAEAEEDAAEA